MKSILVECLIVTCILFACLNQANTFNQFTGRESCSCVKNEKRCITTESDVNGSDQISRNPTISKLVNGDFVVAWIKDKKVFAQRFGSDGKPIDLEFEVNNDPTGVHDCSYPRIKSLSDGSFIITYGDTGDSIDTYAQRFSAYGKKIGDRFKLNTITSNYQMGSVIAELKNGKIAFAWDSLYRDGNGWGVSVQIFYKNGTKIGSELQANTYTADDQYECNIASLADGNFVVVWFSRYQDDPSDGYQTGGVYGQIFDSNGTRVGSEFRLNTFTKNCQRSVAVIGLKNTNFVATWISEGQDGSGFGVYAQIFDSNGNKVGPEFQVNTYWSGNQLAGQQPIARLTDDSFVVTWRSDFGDGHGLFAQRFDLNGTKIGQEFQVNSLRIQNGADYPHIDSFCNNDFAIVWNRYFSNQNGNVNVKRFSSNCFNYD